MNFLRIGNLMFIGIESNDRDIKRKYVKMTHYVGILSLTDIYTYDEIKAQHPDIKEANDIKELLS